LGPGFDYLTTGGWIISYLVQSTCDTWGLAPLSSPFFSSLRVAPVCQSVDDRKLSQSLCLLDDCDGSALEAEWPSE